MLVSSLIFWGNKTTEKAFYSLKTYREQSIQLRKKLRNFWCIRSMVVLIESSSVYDKTVYPSQAMNLHVSGYNQKELSITIGTYEHIYKRKLFNNWKQFY